MLVLTTPNIEGKKIVRYLGLVSGEAILGANIFKDFFASIRDIVGGRSAAYEKELRKAKEIAINKWQFDSWGKKYEWEDDNRAGMRINDLLQLKVFYIRRNLLSYGYWNNTFRVSTTH